MTKLKHLSILLAGCLLTGTLAGSVSAQPWRDRDRDWDRGREWRDRDWDRDWDRDRRWRGGDRDRDCYYVRREFRNRYGERVVRRYRVCDD